MKIGELVQRFGVSVDTIRFYEKQGLLHPASRSAAGYRLYQQRDCDRLHFILRAKAAGFNLQQIRELLAIEDNKANWVCADVKDRVQAKILEIDQQIAELTQLRTVLAKLDRACCGGTVSATECSILATFEQ